MKKSNKFVKQLIKSNKKDVTYIISNKYTNNLPIKFRLITYNIANEQYYLGTTLTSKQFTTDLLKELYYKRWNIETYFRTIKYGLSFNDFHSRTEEQIKQEIIVHMCVTILTRILENIYIKYNPKIKNKLKYNKTHFKNNLDKICSKVIKLLLYEKDVQKIITILNKIFKYLVKIRKNRKFMRIRIIPPSNWYQHPEKINKNDTIK